MQEEIWKKIDGFEDFEVSNRFRVTDKNGKYMDATSCPLDHVPYYFIEQGSGASYKCLGLYMTDIAKMKFKHDNIYEYGKSGKYRVKIGNKHIATADSLTDAIKIRDEWKSNGEK
jgi:hypothetical protein